MNKIDRSTYNADHPQARREEIASAHAILPLIKQLIPVERVLDVGCGHGAFLSVWKELGAHTLAGIEGPWISRENLCVPATTVSIQDLEQTLDIDGVFDLVMCLEVAEHLAPERAHSLVRELTDRAPVVLFSAAIPGQGGTGHINEQWPEYWIRLFKAHGYEVVDAIRPHIWNSPDVCWWHAQNVFLFVRWNLLDTNPAVEAAWQASQSVPARLVHPGLYANLHQSLTQAAATRSLAMSILDGIEAFTMESRKRQISFVTQVISVVEQRIPGDIVECGVWRGGLMMLAARTLLALGDTSRHLWLYDTFSGMTRPAEVDKDFEGNAALDTWEARKTGENQSDWCAASLESVRQNLASTGYPMENVHFVKGDISETASTHPSAIAALRIDVDWYALIMACAEHLIPRTSPDGFITISDYSDWAGAQKAGNEIIAARGAEAPLQIVDGMLVLRANPEANVQ